MVSGVSNFKQSQKFGETSDWGIPVPFFHKPTEVLLGQGDWCRTGTTRAGAHHGKQKLNDQGLHHSNGVAHLSQECLMV